MATYRNPWHTPGNYEHGPAMYETEVKPVHYRGYLIYHRIAYDVVLGDLCVGQYHGLSGAKRFVDLLLDGSDEDAGFHRARVSEYEQRGADYS